MGKPFIWSERKNAILQSERGVSFEGVEAAIAEHLLDVRENTSKNHRRQLIFIVAIHGYPRVAPFHETADAIRLITAYPNRKLINEFEAQIQTDQGRERDRTRVGKREFPLSR